MFRGVDTESFREHYAPLCRKIGRDNVVGQFLFAVAGLVQKARFARRGVLRMTLNEQASEGRRRMSEILWDLFSGSTSYTSVFLRTLHPVYIAGLAWNLVAGNLPGNARSNGQAAGGVGRHAGH